jgi:class 3 adenylate cyclase
MADLNRMDRAMLCSVVYADIANYSLHSVELQMKLKARFNDYLNDAIRNVPENDHLIIDTGDGAFICFFGAPEVAMFAALELQQSFLRDEREQKHGLRVRIGINLGTVTMVKGSNGALTPIGDVINAGQRIMSFAAENQILVSQSFFEVVSCLSDDYKALFKLKGIERDKHVREHTVYNLFPPGWDRAPIPVAPASQQTTPAPAAASRKPSPAPESVPKSNSSAGGRWIALLIGGAALAVFAAAGAWHFYRSGVPATPSITATLTGQGQISATSPAATPSVEAPAQPSAPVSLPDNSAFDPKSLDPKGNAKLSIDAEQMPIGLDFTVEMNGKIYFRRRAEGNRTKYENFYVPPGVQQFKVTARSADMQKDSNIVSTEFKAKKRKTLKVELRSQGQSEDKGMPQGLYRTHRSF